MVASVALTACGGGVAIASLLRHPKAPMPSFSVLANQDPEKFKELVDFISMLR
jgi:hypothetical protein